MDAWNKNCVLTGIWLFIVATVGFFVADHTSKIHGIYLLITWISGVIIIWGSREL